MAAACTALSGQAGRRLVALRALARGVDDLDGVARLQEKAADDVDLRWRALTRKAELGGDTAAEAAQLLENDPDPDARMRVLAVRAAAPDAGEKAAIWQMLVDRTVPISSFFRVATAFWRPEQAELLAPYAERYLELLPHLDRGGMIPAMVYSSRLFPLFGIDEDFLDRAEAAAQQAAPVVRKTVLGRADAVRRMLRSRNR